MLAKYKIIDFNSSTGQLTVEFAPNMAPLSIDVPIKNGLFITGEELDSYIKGFVPTWHLERISQLNAGVSNADALTSLVEAPTVTEEAKVQVVTNTVIEEAEEAAFEQRVAKALIKLGVLA